MGKHIKPFIPEIYDMNEDSFIDYEKGTPQTSKEQVSLAPENVKQMKDTHKDISIKNIEMNLKSALKEYWETKKMHENIILEAKERLNENFKNMLLEFETAIGKLDNLGIEIKNNELELDELTIVLRKEEKMYELSDKDKSELYDIFVSLNKAHADACKDLAKSMNAISEFIQYTEFGVYFKKPEGAKRHKEAYFRTELINPIERPSDVNESFMSKMFEFFKSVGEKIGNYIFNIENSLSNFDSLMDKAKNIVR